MHQANKFKALGRAISVVMAVAVLATGVTFAALQSQRNVLTGNTIETATANLVLSKDDITYSNSQTGFDFGGILPGGAPLPAAGYPFYLKDNGQTDLALTMAVTSAPTNPSNVDLSKVNVLLTTVGSGSSPQTFTLQSLLTSGGVPVGNIYRNNGIQYKLQISMASDAVSGNSASLGNIDFSFSGSALTN